MSRIQVKDEAILRCSPVDAFRLISDYSSYSKWWPRFILVKPLQVKPESVGSQVSIRPFGTQKFICQIESVKKDSEIRVRYVEGVFQGSGTWTLSGQMSDGQMQTCVAYAIDLQIKDPLIQVVSYFLNLTWMHSLVMRRVFQGLEGCSLSQKRISTSVHPSISNL